MGTCEEKGKPTFFKYCLCKLELKVAFTKYAVKRLISPCRSCNFWAEEGDKIWTKLNLCVNTPQGAGKKNSSRSCREYLQLSVYLGRLYPLPCGCLQLAICFCSCIPSGQFYVHVWKRKYFPFFNPGIGYLFACDGCLHFAARCCLFLMLYFISNPES